MRGYSNRIQPDETSFKVLLFCVRIMNIFKRISKTLLTMHFSLGFFCCLLMLTFCNYIATNENDFSSILHDLSNLTCAQEKCSNYFQNRKDSLIVQSCHCGIHCVQLGTCCLDSPYVYVPQPKHKPVCLPTYKGKSYFMVNRCRSTDSMWAELCNADWKGDNLVKRIVPVTSLSTSITYKNYYCFRCNEMGDEFLYWTVKLESNSVPKGTTGHISRLSDKTFSLVYHRPNMMYQNRKATWLVAYDAISNFPVNLSLVIPFEIREMVHVCVQDVISDCSEKWSQHDIVMINKCQGYTAIKEVKRNVTSIKYRNIHCALCNFENFADVLCKEPEYADFDFVSEKPVPFQVLLDMNRANVTTKCLKGQLYDPFALMCRNNVTTKCLKDHMYDPFSLTCRKLACAIPGFIIKDGRCVKESK